MTSSTASAPAPDALVPAAASTAKLAVAAGTCWVFGITLVATQADTDPVGSGYDDANRVMTVACALLFTSALLAWRQVRFRARLLTVIGTALMLLGNALEFIVLPLTGGTPDALVTPGGDTSPLSTGGFLVFAVGLLLVVGACIAIAISLRRHRRADRLLIAVTGPAFVAGTALWAVDPAPAAIAACLGAFGWWRTISTVRDRGEGHRHGD
jgi:hypothetical protein